MRGPEPWVMGHPSSYLRWWRAFSSILLTMHINYIKTNVYNPLRVPCKCSQSSKSFEVQILLTLKSGYWVLEWRVKMSVRIHLVSIANARVLTWRSPKFATFSLPEPLTPSCLWDHIVHEQCPTCYFHTYAIEPALGTQTGISYCSKRRYDPRGRRAWDWLEHHKKAPSSLYRAVPTIEHDFSPAGLQSESGRVSYPRCAKPQSGS